jgi:hypothetical protein
VAELTWIDTLTAAEERVGWRRVHAHDTGHRRSGRKPNTAGSPILDTPTAESSARDAASGETDSLADTVTEVVLELTTDSAGAIAGGSAGRPPVDCGVAFFARLVTGVPPSKTDARRLAAFGLPAVGDPGFDPDVLAVALFGRDAPLLESARELLQSFA